jgi:hypothetical protein
MKAGQGLSEVKTLQFIATMPVAVPGRCEDLRHIDPKSKMGEAHRDSSSTDMTNHESETEVSKFVRKTGFLEVCEALSCQGTKEFRAVVYANARCGKGIQFYFPSTNIIYAVICCVPRFERIITHVCLLL